MEPKGSWSEGFKQGKAKGCFDLRDAKQRAKDAETLLKRAVSQLGKWHKWYGCQTLDVLPPYGDLVLMEDVDEFLSPTSNSRTSEDH